MVDPWIWALMFIAVAAGLAVLELFIPSGGILAFLSIAALIAAVVFAFKSGPIVGLIFVVAVMAGTPTALILAVKWWPHTTYRAPHHAPRCRR